MNTTNRLPTALIPPNLKWWDQHTHESFYEHNQITLVHVPRSTLDEFIHTKGTILKTLPSPAHHADHHHHDTPRLWKLLLHFDRIILSRPHQATNHSQHTQAQLVRSRLQHNREGKWDLLHNTPDAQDNNPVTTPTLKQTGKK